MVMMEAFSAFRRDSIRKVDVSGHSLPVHPDFGSDLGGPAGFAADPARAGGLGLDRPAAVGYCGPVVECLSAPDILASAL
jgi:hypothetical protein